MHVCVSLECLVPVESKGITGGYEVSCGCWKSNPSLLEEHPVLLVAEPSSHPQAISFLLTTVLVGSPVLSVMLGQNYALI